MKTDELPSRLMDISLSGQPWPASLERTLAKARPGNLLRLFRDLGVRNELIAPEGMPTLDELLNHVKKSSQRNDQVTVPRMLTLLRAQWAHYMSEFSEQARDRLNHVWQIQACPITIRKRMSRLLGITFMPGRRLEAFPDGEEFIELSDLHVLSLGFRQHWSKESRRVVDMLDVKVHGIAVDPHSGQAKTEPKYARYFNFAPFPGADRRIVEADNHSVIHSGLDLHKAMEWTAITGSGVRDEPEFPRIYLAFDEAGSVDLEVTTDLKIAAWRELDAYVRAGRPSEWERCYHLVELRDKLDNRPRTTWADYAKKLGAKDAEFALMAAVDAYTCIHKNLYLMPLEFFQPFSPQRPVKQAVKVFARMEPNLLKRDRLLGVPRFEEGRFVGIDPVTEPLERMARLQVIRTPDRSHWAGTSGIVEWDFRVAPPWSQDFFMEAGSQRAWAENHDQRRFGSKRDQQPAPPASEVGENKETTELIAAIDASDPDALTEWGEKE